MSGIGQQSKIKRLTEFCLFGHKRLKNYKFRKEEAIEGRKTPIIVTLFLVKEKDDLKY